MPLIGGLQWPPLSHWWLAVLGCGCGSCGTPTPRCRIDWCTIGFVFRLHLPLQTLCRPARRGLQALTKKVTTTTRSGAPHPPLHLSIHHPPLRLAGHHPRRRRLHRRLLPCRATSSSTHGSKETLTLAGQACPVRECCCTASTDTRTTRSHGCLAHAAWSKCPLGSATAQRLCLRRTHLASPGSLLLPGRGPATGSPATEPSVVLERPACKTANHRF